MVEQIQGPTCCENGVRGYGSIQSRVMFIGIAPGQDEWRRTKKPLTGPSGKLLDAILDAINIPRSEVYCTNLLCWWKDSPTKDDIAICAPRLQQEYQLVKPKLVVLLGKIACESVLNLPFSKARGAVIPSKGPNQPMYLVTNHPAACLHRAMTLPEKEVQINAAYDLCRDFSKIPRILAGEYEWIEPTYGLITTPEQAQQFLDSIPKDRPVALDIETNYDKEYEKSHPFTSKIICIGIGWEDSHCTILTEQSLIPQLVWPQDVIYTYHNGPFDTQQIAKELGTWLPIKRDTMAASVAWDERSIRGLHKLKVLQRELIGSTFYEEDEHHIGPQQTQQAVVTKEGKLTLVQAPNDEEQLAKLYLYNAKDVTGTVRLERFLDQKLIEDNVQQVYHNLILPLEEVLARSQLRGIYVSPKNMIEVIDVLEPVFESTQQDLAAMAAFAGFPDLNVRSPKQLQAMFLSENISLPNTRKATLQEYMDTNESPFMSTLLKYRTVHKLLRNYLLDIQKHVMHDSRVHPTAFFIGTSTGRLTYRDPAMQTLPKEKTVGKELGIIRKIFAATTDDYTLLEVDYAQIEAWLGAYFSKDNALLADLQSSDWHTTVAQEMFHVSTTDPQFKFYRDAAKHINYGSMYGEEARGLTRRPPIGIGCDLQTAQDYLNRWRAHYPTFVQYQKQQQKLAQNQGYIQTPFGRKRRFPLIVNDHQLRQAVNCEIQSAASDYTLTSAIKLHPLLQKLDTHLLFVEHDALYYEVNNKHLQEVMPLIKETMQAPPLPGLPAVKVVITTGPNLVDQEEVVI